MSTISRCPWPTRRWISVSTAAAVRLRVPPRTIGMTKVHVFPYSPRPGTRTAAEDAVAPDVKRDRAARLRALSDELCRRRWLRRVGSFDRVLVDRPGRGYADDYTPWLVDAPVGQLVRARATGVAADGVLAVAA